MGSSHAQHTYLPRNVTGHVLTAAGQSWLHGEVQWRTWDCVSTICHQRPCPHMSAPSHTHRLLLSPVSSQTGFLPPSEGRLSKLTPSHCICFQVQVSGCVSIKSLDRKVLILRNQNKKLTAYPFLINTPHIPYTCTCIIYCAKVRQEHNNAVPESRSLDGANATQ